MNNRFSNIYNRFFFLFVFASFDVVVCMMIVSITHIRLYYCLVPCPYGLWYKECILCFKHKNKFFED